MHGHSGVSKQNTMKPRLKSSPAARELIKRYQPYLGIAEQGADGQWSVGYGHRAAARDGVRVTEDEASLLLIYDILQVEEAIESVIAGELSRQQRDALVSFVHGIGIAAFKQSDVARYLFEGRSMAAGEAIALYGETETDRREAESGLFLTTFAPPKRPAVAPQKDSAEAADVVELVIKIEHEPAAETENAAHMRAIPQAEPAAPPPMPGPASARREAEDEIARILASVGSLPVEDIEPVVTANRSDAVLDLDLPEARLPVAAPEPVVPEASESEPVERDSADTIADNVDADGVSEEPVDAYDDAAESALVDDAPAEGLAEPVAEGEPVAEAEPEAQAEAEEEPQRRSQAPLGFASAPIFAAVPLDRLAVQPVPESERRGRETETETADSADEPVGEADPVEDDAVSAEAIAEEAASSPDMIEPPADVAPVDPVLGDDRDPVETAVASFAPEVEDAAAQRVLDRMVEDVEREAEAEVQPAAEVFVERHMPIGTSLGYVLAGELVGRIETGPIDDVLEDEAIDESEAQVETEPGDVAAEPAEVDAETPEAIEAQLVARMEEDLVDSQVQADADAELADTEFEIVEARITVTGDETPPPHPAETPAVPASGEVGEVEVGAEAQRPNADVLADDIIASDFDPIQDEEFTPQDLAGGETLPAAAEAAPAKSSGGFGLGMLLPTLGFAVAAVVGWVWVVDNWSLVLAEKPLNLEVAMAAFGTPAAIFTASVWIMDLRSKLRSRKSSPAE